MNRVKIEQGKSRKNNSIDIEHLEIIQQRRIYLL